MVHSSRQPEKEAGNAILPNGVFLPAHQEIGVPGIVLKVFTWDARPGGLTSCGKSHLIVILSEAKNFS
jgi:hypothetical protein